MAISVTLNPSETLVRSGQSVSFMLEIANTDGANRVLKSVTVGAAPGPGGFAGAIDLNLGSGITLTDAATTYIPFNGVFYAQASNLPDTQTSMRVSFVLNYEIDSTAGAVTSVGETTVCSMSVVPEGSTTPNVYFGPYNTLDFESNNNGIFKQLHFV